MDLNQSTGNRMPSQEHLNVINKLNDAKIPRQSQLIANRLFMKNFPRDVRRRSHMSISMNDFLLGNEGRNRKLFPIIWRST